MGRYTDIHSVSFAGSVLPLPLSARIVRKVEISPAGGEEAFATSVQTAEAAVTAEVRIRDTAAAEALSLGEQGELVLTIGASESGQAGRAVTLAGAVLSAVELAYEQSSMASAVLRFVAEAAGGGSDPFSAEDES